MIRVILDENEATTLTDGECAMRLRVETTAEFYGKSALIVALEANWISSLHEINL